MKADFEINSNATEKKLKTYLSMAELESLDNDVSEKQILELFITFTKDFLSYQLLFDEYSTLCEKLLGALIEIKPRDNSELYWVLHFGAELSWYIRNEPARAAEFSETMLSFYKSKLP